MGGASDGYGVHTLNSYKIEYLEDGSVTDTTLNNHSPISMMRHVREVKRLLVLQDKDAGVHMVDEQLRSLSYLNPAEVVQHNGKCFRHEGDEVLRVTDILYIPFKDLYVYSASDHSINFVKEHSTAGRKRIHYTLHHRINHAYLQVKLCWSEKSMILCSVDSGECH